MGEHSRTRLLHQQLDLSTTAAALAQLQIELDGFYRHASGMVEGLDDPESLHTLLAAVMEIAENTIHHAYEIPSPDHWLRVEFSLFADRIEIVLADGGFAFDPLRIEKRDLAQLWTSSARGGWGLILAQRAADDLSYAREDGINVWKMVAMIGR